MDNNTMLKNNKGFSLVELIVVVLITGILMMAVGVFMSTSRAAFITVHISATLQEEAMTVERVLSEYMMEAFDYGLEEDVSITGTSYKADVLWILAKENDGVSGAKDPIYFFVRDREKNELRFCKGEDGMAGDSGIASEGNTKIKDNCYGTKEKFSLVAEHIKSIAINKSKHQADGTDLVVLEIEYNYLDTDYTNVITIVTRNKKK